MFNFEWTKLEINTEEDFSLMVDTFMNDIDNLLATGFDTETTGLHIICDSPFLYQFGWITKYKKGYSYIIDIDMHDEQFSKRVISFINTLCAMYSPIHIAHNVKFDLHMLINFGTPYTADNIADLSSFIRLGTDAVATKHGGAPMDLKSFATMYIDGNAKSFEKELKDERSDKAKYYNMLLRKRLGCTAGYIKEFFKDSINDVEDLPNDKVVAYNEWLTLDLPLYLKDKIIGIVNRDDIQYNTLNRDTVKKYAHMDIVYLLESYYKLSIAVKERGNDKGIEYERANIYPVLAMERVGFCIDVEYLYKAKKDVKEYLIQRRQDLHAMAGTELSVGQHAKIKEILNSVYDLHVESTGNEELDLLVSDLQIEGGHEDAIEFIQTIQELRTLEKWYSTYILRFINNIKRHDINRVYTQINLSGTVSGRVTSDFQQFPKNAIKRVDGTELFHPRRMVIADKNNNIKALAYIDYSQIELRLQAMYTILVGHPDTNLCKAYMPYGCTDKDTGEQFDYNNKEHIAKAYNGNWIESDGTAWTPLDVHGATTKTAFGITEDHPDFHKLRYIGKRVNFSKNYGAGIDVTRRMFPNYSEEEIERIDSAYYKVFPGVKEYHNYCYARASQPYTSNLFGVRYYNVSGHNLRNMLVQGSAAYLLKTKIVEVYNYIKNSPYNINLAMQIHDELIFEIGEGTDYSVLKDIANILETWEDTLVPIVADIEITESSWADKYELEVNDE